MKISRKAANSKPAASDPTPPVPPAEAAGAGKFVSKASNRILVPITSAGLIDFARMQKDSQKQLTDLLNREAVQKQLGFGRPAEQFDPEQCERIYDLVGRLYQTIGSLLLKYPEQANAQLLYTNEEKQELGPPTAKMLDAYAPKWLAEHQAFAAWAAVFAGVTQAKFARANQVAAFVKANPQAGIAAEVPAETFGKDPSGDLKQ